MLPVRCPAAKKVRNQPESVSVPSAARLRISCWVTSSAGIALKAAMDRLAADGTSALSAHSGPTCRRPLNSGRVRPRRHRKYPTHAQLSSAASNSPTPATHAGGVPGKHRAASKTTADNEVTSIATRADRDSVLGGHPARTAAAAPAVSAPAVSSAAGSSGLTSAPANRRQAIVAAAAASNVNTTTAPARFMPAGETPTPRPIRSNDR